ncbi:class I SAM-dependent methyltransferase [Chloroflexota bacterium]
MIRAYFNQQAAFWDETIAEKDVTRLQRMAERLEIKPGSTLLDVGTGTGVFLPYLLGKIGEHGKLVAVDCAEEMLKIARAKGFPGNIEYLHADVASVPLPEEMFDAVVCYSSFPHFQDKPIALGEIRRVLKKGGRLFVCHTTSRDIINGIHRQIPAVRDDLIPDGDEIRAMLSAAGFDMVQIDDDSESYLASAVKPKGGDSPEVPTMRQRNLPG